MSENQYEKTQEKLKKKAQKVQEKDLTKVLDKREQINSKFEGKGRLGKFAEDVKLLFSLVQDYKNKEYRDIPWWTVAAIVVALLYVLNPLDLVPDFLPGVGYIDDATVIAACLAMVHKDLQRYKTWKIEQTDIQDNSPQDETE